jgi:hypothetical protein
MKHRLVLGLLALAGAQSAHAIFQFDVELADLDNVSCWNAAACEATAATVHMYNPANPTETLTVDCNVFGPAGQPAVYQFQADVDAQINCAITYIIDELWVSYDGPGFHYEFTHVPPAFTMFYQCGPSFPVDIDAPAGDGCIPFDPGFEWTWANFPNGRVDLTEDFTIPADASLYIEAGMQVYGLPGCGLTIEGDVYAEGTRDNWIEFTGDNWDGITFANNAEQQAEMWFCKVHNVNSPDNGGAFTMNTGSVANLFYCLVAHNTTAGDGGAAYIADGGSFSAYNCTVSHNTGAMVGGVYLAGGSALFTSNMTLLTQNAPANTELVGTGAIPNVTFTNIFPQSEGFPENMPLINWACDPGYVNPTEGDFNISYWSVDNPSEMNCIIDVSLIPEANDPDGTPGDMGAFPFDQNQIMHPATILAVTDRADDQGGFVLVEFMASPNDGSWLNPTTMYSVWVRYPTMEEGWVSAGTVAALGDPEGHYWVQVPTLDDQYEGMENIHHFMIGTHSVHFPTPAASNVVTGFSLDNLAPQALASVGNGDWFYDSWPPENDLVDLNWAASPANDFAHYVVRTALVDDFQAATVLYSGTNTQAQFVLPFGQLEEEDMVYYWVSAVDEHMNEGPAVQGIAEYVGMSDRLPVAYELAQNFPNPFNPATTIEYALPQAGPASLKVFNVLGGEVATLVSGVQPAGRFQVQFDASRLSSGVYFYKLEAPGFSDLKKMILVK